MAFEKLLLFVGDGEVVPYVPLKAVEEILVFHIASFKWLLAHDLFLVEELVAADANAVIVAGDAACRYIAG